MTKKAIQIQISEGADARPIAMLVQVASQYESQIYVEVGSKKVNAKSIMGMMSLGLCNNEEIEIEADGSDAVSAIDAIVSYMSPAV